MDGKKQKQQCRNTGRAADRTKKTGRKNQKFDSKEARFDERAAKGQTEASNDPGWYGAGSALMQDAASLPFHSFAGVQYNLGSVGVPQESCINSGILVFQAMPVPGAPKDWKDPFNLFVRDNYSFIRHANSGHSNYDASDLGKYYLAYDSAVTFYAWMVRAYGLLRTVYAKNRYTPEALVEASGMDYSSLVASMAQFRAYINVFAAQLSALKMPATNHLLERHMWMFSNVYMDAPVQKAHMYIFKPAGFWVYDQFAKINDDYKDGTFNVEKIPNEKGMTYYEMVNLGNKLIAALLNNESFNIMSGDILKAYGDNVYHINTIDENYQVVPTYDPEMLIQIHNATVLYASPESWQLGEYLKEDPNVGALVSHFIVPQNWVSNNPMALRARRNTYAYLSKILDLPLESPSATDVAIATRFAVGVRAEKPVDLTKATTFELDVAGTEVITGAYTITLRPESGGFTYTEWTVIENIEMFSGHPR